MSFKVDEYIKIQKNNIFNFNFSLPEIPKNILELNINFNKMNKNSENLFVPIINIDSDGKNLTCCFKTLDLNFGKICPALYHRNYTINIISFVNEDKTIKIKNYNENKIYNKMNKEEKSEEIEMEENKDKIEEEQKEIKSLIHTGDEIVNNYLSVKELVKKGENIQIYVEVPETFEEDTIKISSVLDIESTSGKKLDLPISIIFTIVPISVLITCQEKKLINMNKDNTFPFEHWFELDVDEFFEDEEINFEILNYQKKDTIDFFIKARSLDENTSQMPIFQKTRQKNNFKITIPKYNYQNNENEVSRLQCVLELFINKYFVINIKIDSLIKPNINVFKMYDFYTKDFVENQIVIYLNEISQELFKKEKKFIQLKCLLYSTLENEQFTVIPEGFDGGQIEQFKGVIKNRQCQFNLTLKFTNNQIISNDTNCQINIIIIRGKIKIPFNIKFQYPEKTDSKEEHFLRFQIKGKNDLEDNWRNLDKERTKFYVTPFESSKIEIDYKDIDIKLFRDKIFFYYINNSGTITKMTEYKEKINEGSGWFGNKNFKIPFSVCYQNIWYPLIKYNQSFYGYECIYFEYKGKIKEQVNNNFKKWEKKVQKMNVYDEIFTFCILFKFINFIF